MWIGNPALVPQRRANLRNRLALNPGRPSLGGCSKVFRLFHAERPSLPVQSLPTWTRLSRWSSIRERADVPHLREAFRYVDLEAARVWVDRVKGGQSTH
jgi:hypothetical protein